MTQDQYFAVIEFQSLEVTPHDLALLACVQRVDRGVHGQLLVDPRFTNVVGERALSPRVVARDLEEPTFTRTHDEACVDLGRWSTSVHGMQRDPRVLQCVLRVEVSS